MFFLALFPQNALLQTEIINLGRKIMAFSEVNSPLRAVDD